jgi:hypothetical protein
MKIANVQIDVQALALNEAKVTALTNQEGTTQHFLTIDTKQLIAGQSYCISGVDGVFWLKQAL